MTTMPLKDQVCSLELAKKLKELGVEQKSLFYWMRSLKPDNWQIVIEHRLGFLFENGADLAKHRKDEFEMLSAFTVAELGEMLPAGIFSDKGAINSKWMGCIARFSKFKLDKQDRENIETPIMECKTEANARAKMLIYLLENKLITL